MKPHVIYSDAIDGKAMSQFFDALKQEWVVKGALMPDAHAGYSLPIGAVVATEGVVLPSWVGFDIGCGMLAVQTSFDAEPVRAHAKGIFNRIYRDVPTGFSHNKRADPWVAGEALPSSKAVQGILKHKGMGDLHSLGGGNHFIELGADESGQVWIVIHSGSRNLGHSVATHYMKVASREVGRAVKRPSRIASMSRSSRSRSAIKVAMRLRGSISVSSARRTSCWMTVAKRLSVADARGSIKAETRRMAWVAAVESSYSSSEAPDGNCRVR